MDGAKATANVPRRFERWAGGKLYVIGGWGRPDNGQSNDLAETREYKAHVEIYDPASDTWSIGRPAPVPRAGGSSCALNGSIYVFTSVRRRKCGEQRGSCLGRSVERL